LKGLVLFALGTALIVAGIFLIRRGREMWTTQDYQLNGQPDSWYDFTRRWDAFGFGAGAIFFGCLCIYGALATFFSH
jgi:hypothetical protein